MESDREKEAKKRKKARGAEGGCRADEGCKQSDAREEKRNNKQSVSRESESTVTASRNLRIDYSRNKEIL